MKTFLLYFFFLSSLIGLQAQTNITVSLPADVHICEGSGSTYLNLQPSVIGGTLPYTFSWWANVPLNQTGGLIPDSANQILSPVVNACYYIQVTDSQGVTSNIDTFCFEILPLPIATAGADVFRCINQQGCVSLQASISPNNLAPAPFSFSWTPNSGMMPGQDTLLNPFVNPSITTIYEIFVTSANGCSSPNSLDTLTTVTCVVGNLPTIFLPIMPNDTIALGDSIWFPCNSDLNNVLMNATFSWDVGNGIPSDSCPYILHPTQTTTYTAFVMTNTGCIDSLFYTVYILPLSLDNEEDKFHLSLFPNPSDGHFCVKWENGSVFSLEIFEVHGKKIYAESVGKTAKKQHELDISFLPKGIYYINICIDGQTFWQKLILS